MEVWDFGNADIFTHRSSGIRLPRTDKLARLADASSVSVRAISDLESGQSADRTALAAAAGIGGVAPARAGLDELVHVGLLAAADSAGRHRDHDLVRLDAAAGPGVTPHLPRRAGAHAFGVLMPATRAVQRCRVPASA